MDGRGDLDAGGVGVILFVAASGRRVGRRRAAPTLGFGYVRLLTLEGERSVASRSLGPTPELARGCVGLAPGVTARGRDGVGGGGVAGAFDAGSVK